MTTILKASGAAELLALVPVLSGFTPRRSAVLLPFAGRRTAGAIRFDLPEGDSGSERDPGSVPDAGSGSVPSPNAGEDPVTTEARERFAATAVGLACRVPDTDALAIVLYRDEPLTAGEDASPSPFPGAALMDDLLLRATACGLRIVEALCVGTDAWGDYFDPDRVRHDLGDLPAAPAVPGLAPATGDQTTGGQLPPADLAEKERIGRAWEDVEEALSSGYPRCASARVDPRAFAATLALDDLPAFLEDLLDAPQNLPPFTVAALIAVLARPALRDVALIQWARGKEHGERALEAQIAFDIDPGSFPADIGEVMLGRGARPDPDRLGLALSLARSAAALAPRRARPGALAAAAWLSWALGRSTPAAHHLDQALLIDPEHSFAGLLRRLLNASPLPDWVFARARA